MHRENSIMKKLLCYSLLILTVAACSAPEQALELPKIQVPDGFEATHLYSPSANGQGSWVSLTTDHKGRLIASDQYGSLYRITLNEGTVEVDSIPLAIGSAQGLLWAYNSLYISVNTYDSNVPGSGIYRLIDTDNDDELDEVEKLASLDGAGEHGPHALVLGPDDLIYMIAGNHTDIPESFASYTQQNWATDRLFTPVLDPRGHANDRDAPGGWIARFDKDGDRFEVIANGFRNAYDIAFNNDGQLFTFDSDMEWDLGTPWYRPIRVCQVVPGSEFGWRSGSGKWPAYYPDNLGGILDVGQGSPTGIVFGHQAAFPSEFRTSLYISDWSFGTIYRVNLQPAGSSYTAAKTEFLSGTPLPITDVVVGSDGNMYFTTGGRRGESHLYRVAYKGSLADEPEVQTASESQGSPDLSTIWNGLASEERIIRFQSRVELEKYPIEQWISHFEGESQPKAIIQASLAAARTAPEYFDRTFDKLNEINSGVLSYEDQLDLIRAYGLLFSRTGNQRVPQNLPRIPSENPAVDREVVELRVFLNDPDVVPIALDLMEKAESTLEADLTPQEVLQRSEQYGPTIAAMYENRPLEQGLAHALSLSHATVGWSNTTRMRYFTWFYRSMQKNGGMSYKGFVEKIRLQALSNVPESDRKELAQISGEALLTAPSLDANVRGPEGPGRAWVISDAGRAVNGQLYNRSLQRGQELYQALLCASCHAMNGSGGNVGPDLTQAGTRFSNYDILNSMILPSMSISDQYGASLITFDDGKSIIGRIVRTTDDSLFVSQNPFSTETDAYPVTSISSQEPSPVSMMPAGLINSLNEEELRDLMAYIVSAGDPDHEVYQPKPSETD